MANTRPGPRGGASGFNRKPGVRQMKEYPLTKSELWTLGGLQAGSALSFSIAGWLTGFYLNARQAVQFAGNDVSREVLGQWQGYADMAWYGAAFTWTLGVLLVALGGINVLFIIWNTEHAP